MISVQPFVQERMAELNINKIVSSKIIEAPAGMSSTSFSRKAPNIKIEATTVS